jgi:hypothetical protein
LVEFKHEGDFFEVSVEQGCRAPCEAVYDLLADLKSHLEWGGRRHPQTTQRMLSIVAPEGPAVVGVEFESIGATSGRQWHDHSVVTVAERPHLFEFATEGNLENPENGPIQGAWTHRYELVPDGEGCLVRYLGVRTRFAGSMPTLPHIVHPELFYNVVVPSVVERGVCNLVALAEERAGVAAQPDGR